MKFNTNNTDSNITSQNTSLIIYLNIQGQPPCVLSADFEYLPTFDDTITVDLVESDRESEVLTR